MYQKVKKQVKDLKEGDLLMDEYGNPVPIKKLYDIILKPPLMYRITTENGENIKVSGDHLFLAFTLYTKKNQDYFNELLLEEDISDLRGVPEECSLDELENAFSKEAWKKDLVLFCAKMLGPVAYIPLSENSEEDLLWLYSSKDILETIKKLKEARKYSSQPLWEILSAKDIAELIHKGEEVFLAKKIEKNNF